MNFVALGILPQGKGYHVNAALLARCTNGSFDPRRETKSGAEDDVPAQWEVFKEINKVYFEQGHDAGEKMLAEFIAAKE